LQDRAAIFRALERRNFELAAKLLRPNLNAAPFSTGVVDVIDWSVARIIEAETARGAVNKRARAALADESQPYQDFIDQVLFDMAGFSEPERTALEQRLSKMM